MCLIPCNLCHSRHKYQLLQLQKSNSCSSRRKSSITAFTLVRILLPYHLYAADYLLVSWLKSMQMKISIYSICVTPSSNHGLPTGFHTESSGQGTFYLPVLLKLFLPGVMASAAANCLEKRRCSLVALQCWSWAGMNAVQPNENCILVTRLGQRSHLVLSINFSLKQ